MNVPVLERNPASVAGLGMVDCDVHVYPARGAALDEFLSQRWREHRAMFGARSRQGLAFTANYPRLSPQVGMRRDAWPPGGGIPGSDLDFLRAQLLDAFGVAHGVMLPLVGRGADERNVAFGVAMCAAVNDWQAACWCDPEPRLKASVQINLEDEAAAIAEIERRAGDRRFVQVQIPPRGLEPLGRLRYRRILAACAAHGLPIALHLGGTGGHPSTGGGWPSFYHEEHHSYVQSMEALVTSLVLEGAFAELPRLRVALVEGGFAWLPALAWRLDKHWARLRAEVPWVTRPPSEYIREQVWVTTQPVEEPERAEDMLALLDWIGWDRVMVSTDYPHWDQDDPRYAFKVALPEAGRRAIYRDNALAFYGLS
ncbi:MAG: amidohydrolase [Rhodospirillales bacterium]|nr:amidohydrolase [Rhodospirillales bacterium]